MKSIEELAQAQAAMAAQVNGQGVAPDVIQQTINNLTPKEETRLFMQLSRFLPT